MPLSPGWELGEGNAALLCILSPLAANQGARALSRTGTAGCRGQELGTVGTIWGAAGWPCLALALCGGTGTRQSRQTPWGDNTSSLPPVLMMPTAE